MTLTNPNRSVTYVGDGATTQFPFDFLIPSSDNIRVSLFDTVTEETTELSDGQFSVPSGFNNPNGGYIVYNPIGRPIGPTIELTIERIVPFTQNTHISQQSGFFPENIARGLDWVVMQTQQLRDWYATGSPSIKEWEAAAKRWAEISQEAAIISQAAADAAANWADQAKQSADKAEQLVERTVPEVLRFTGDGVTTSFYTDRPALRKNFTDIYITGVYQQKDTYEISDGWINFYVPPIVTDTDQIEVVIGGNTAFVTEGPFASYRNVDDALSLQVNGTNASWGFTGVRTAAQERNANFTIPGQFPQAPVDLAKCLLIPPTEDSTNWVAPNTPWVENYSDGYNYRLIPLDIRTVLHNTPIGIPLFKPVKTNGDGILVWEYMGEDPMHVLLEGSMTVAIRSAGEIPEAFNRAVLRLTSWDHPQLEDGQNEGKRHLASSLGSLSQPRMFRDVLEFNDKCFPITQEVMDGREGPNLAQGVSINHGFLNPDPEPAWERDPVTGLYLEDQNGPVGNEVRTSGWIDVEGIDFSQHCLVMTFSGTSTRSRIEYRDADGIEHYFHGGSGDYSSYRVFRLPIGTTAFRMYFSGRGDSALIYGGLNCYVLNTELSAQYDPVKGYWSTHTFDVKREVVFWPGTKYSLNFLITPFNNANARSWGFRYQGGGLSFDFDAGKLRRGLSEKLFRSVQ